VRARATINLDREKARLARELTGAESTSAVIDLAVDRLIHACQARRDIEAYKRLPPGQPEDGIAAAGAFGDIDDDTDWVALHPDMET
jgi:hypothetical protein